MAAELQSLFETGRIFDIVLITLALEGLVLWMIRRRTGRGLPVGAIASFLLSGAFLIAAFRTSTLGLGWIWTAMLLSAAFAVHVLELRGRWRAYG